MVKRARKDHLVRKLEGLDGTNTGLQLRTPVFESCVKPNVRLLLIY